MESKQKFQQNFIDCKSKVEIENDGNQKNTMFQVPTFDSKVKYEEFCRHFSSSKLPEMIIVKNWNELQTKIVNSTTKMNKIFTLSNNNGGKDNYLNFNMIRQDMVSNTFWSESNSPIEREANDNDDLFNYDHNLNNHQSKTDRQKQILQKLIKVTKKNLSLFIPKNSKRETFQTATDENNSSNSGFAVGGEDEMSNKWRVMLENTLLKLFYDHGHGIFVEIENNMIKHFIPFLNYNFKNHHDPQMFKPNFEKYDSWKDYYDQYQQNHQHNNISKDGNNYDSHFVINNILIPLERVEKLMHDQLYIIKDMLDTLCSQRKLLNIQFCLKLFDNSNIKVEQNDFFVRPMVPIFNFYSSSPLNNEILVPSKDDWLIATGKYFYGFDNIFRKVEVKSKSEKLPPKKKLASKIHLEKEEKVNIHVDNNINIDIDNVQNIFDLMSSSTPPFHDQHPNLKSKSQIKTKVGPGNTKQPKNHDHDENRFEILDKVWSKKSNILFWRGSTLSSGLDIVDNIRLSLCQISRSSIFKSKLDAAITDVDSMERLKLRARSMLSGDNDNPVSDPISSPLSPFTLDFFNQNNLKGTNQNEENKENEDTNTNIDPKIINIRNYISLNKQVETYKYMIHLDSGYKPSFRYPYLMKNKILIFKVDSPSQNRVYKTWYSDLLIPGTDHLLIRSDLSDLAEKYAWAEQNQGQSLQIVKNAEYIYENFLSENGILDFWQYIINLYGKYKYHENDVKAKNKNRRNNTTNNIKFYNRENNEKDDLENNIKNFVSNLKQDQKDERSQIKSVLFNFEKFENIRTRQLNDFNDDDRVTKANNNTDNGSDNDESDTLPSSSSRIISPPPSSALLLANEEKNNKQKKKRRNKLAAYVESGNVIRKNLTKDQENLISIYLPKQFREHNYKSKKFDPKKQKL